MGPAYPDTTLLAIRGNTRLAACRAYKLGKKRWSYNQCELKIVQEGGDQRLDVVEAVQVSTLLIFNCSRPSFPPLCSCMDICCS